MAIGKMKVGRIEAGETYCIGPVGHGFICVSSVATIRLAAKTG
jgi:hypothetical protein